jgi:ankyrin repeat protein
MHPGGKYGTPLQAASAEGKLNVVKLLLQKDADPNVQGEHSAFLSQYVMIKCQN